MKVVSFCCDKYADIAPTFEYLWHKRWPDCPWELIFVTNSIKLNVRANVQYIKGKDIKYGWRLRRFIQNHYRHDQIFLTMADYLVTGCNPRVILKAAELCQDEKIGHVRLRPMPHPQLPWPDRDFGEIKKNTAYALSLQPGIWDTKLIHDLVRDNENPWHIEVQGSRRMQHVKKTFLSTKKLVLPHNNYYRKGKPIGVEWVRKHVPRKYWPDAAKKRGKK